MTRVLFIVVWMSCFGLIKKGETSNFEQEMNDFHENLISSFPQIKPLKEAVQNFTQANNQLLGKTYNSVIIDLNSMNVLRSNYVICLSETLTQAFFLETINPASNAFTIDSLQAVFENNLKETFFNEYFFTSFIKMWNFYSPYVEQWLNLSEKENLSSAVSNYREQVEKMKSSFFNKEQAEEEIHQISKSLYENENFITIEKRVYKKVKSFFNTCSQKVYASAGTDSALSTREKWTWDSAKKHIKNVHSQTVIHNTPTTRGLRGNLTYLEEKGDAFLKLIEKGKIEKHDPRCFQQVWSDFIFTSLALLHEATHYPLMSLDSLALIDVPRSAFLLEPELLDTMIAPLAFSPNTLNETQETIKELFQGAKNILVNSTMNAPLFDFLKRAHNPLNEFFQIHLDIKMGLFFYNYEAEKPYNIFTLADHFCKTLESLHKICLDEKKHVETQIHNLSEDGKNTLENTQKAILQSVDLWPFEPICFSELRAQGVTIALKNLYEEINIPNTSKLHFLLGLHDKSFDLFSFIFHTLPVFERGRMAFDISPYEEEGIFWNALKNHPITLKADDSNPLILNEKPWENWGHLYKSYRDANQLFKDTSLLLLRFILLHHP